MRFHIEYERTVPERRHNGFRPDKPKFSVRWDMPVTAVISDYLAVQHGGADAVVERAFFERARAGFDEPWGPDCHEELRHTGANGLTDSVVVAYWTDVTRHAMWKRTSSFNAWWNASDRELDGVGYWRETVSVPYDRFETIFSEPYYRVGVGRTARSELADTYTAGYFGAMRDRLPISAIDALESPYGDAVPEASYAALRSRRIRIDLPPNVVSIRSGQYWQQAEGEQLADYYDNLQPKLEAGMQHLVAHPDTSGCLLLRPLVNLGKHGEALRETSKHGYFLSLGHLERWSESHQTHLDIFRHALAMRRKYGAERSVVTWHEVFVLGTAPAFEYLNCHIETGLLPFAHLWGSAASAI